MRGWATLCTVSRLSISVVLLLSESCYEKRVQSLLLWYLAGRFLVFHVVFCWTVFPELVLFLDKSLLNVCFSYVWVTLSLCPFYSSSAAVVSVGHYAECADGVIDVHCEWILSFIPSINQTTVDSSSIAEQQNMMLFKLISLINMNWSILKHVNHILCRNLMFALKLKFTIF